MNLRPDDPAALQWVLDNIYTLARREACRPRWSQLATDDQRERWADEMRERWAHVFRLCERAGCQPLSDDHEAFRYRFARALSQRFSPGPGRADDEGFSDVVLAEILKCYDEAARE